MVSKSYNDLIIQYSNSSGFVHYANETEGASLQSGLTQTAAFEGFESGDIQFTRFFNNVTGDHVFTADAAEVAALQSHANFVEEGETFRLFSAETDGTQAVHRFFNVETGFHHYTADTAEVTRLTESTSYSSEGIVGYGGVVDAREAQQIASSQTTITLNQAYSPLSMTSDGAFNFAISSDNFSAVGVPNVSITAMTEDGTELPEYLGFNESNGQIFGYTLKEGIGSTNIQLVADDGTSQVSSSFSITSSDGNQKTDADRFTEKSLAALMSIQTSSVGGLLTEQSVGVESNTIGTLATPSESSNLAAFQAANPTINGAGTTIAVLDTGIDLDHPFFGSDANGNGVSDRIVGNQDFHNGDFDATDDDGHGTHVAGIAMSSDTSFPGVAPGANVAAVKVLGPNGGSFSGIEAGLQWVLENASTLNITSVNMSLGASDNSTSTLQSSLSDEIAALRSQGIITFVAAGNSFSTYNAEGVSTPASDPSALAISALNSSNDAAASYSQRDTTLTKVFAPGTSITNAAPGDGATTQTLSGTSMATPYVAGVSSLMRQLNPDLSVDDFETFLQQSATVFNDQTTGSDYRKLDVNALGNLVAGGTLPDEPTAPAPTPPATDDQPDSVGSTNTVIAIGTATVGALEEANDRDVFALNVESGGTYTIDLQGSPSNLGTLSDPFLNVLDGSGSRIQSNDDGGFGLESQVVYSATSSGTIYIEARAFSTQTGTYQIDVAEELDDQPDSVGGNASVAAGVPQTGEIEMARDKDVFALDVTSGSSYLIDLRGTNSSLGTLTDPFLKVLNSNGSQLASNDDGGNGLESRLTYQSSTTETIFIEAGAFSTRTGTYQLDIADVTIRDDQPDVIGNNVNLTVGVVQSGDIESGRDVDVYALDVTAGVTYTIDQKGFYSDVGTLTDPLLKLRDSAGTLLAENDDGGFRLESQLTYTPTASETVFVEAGAFSTRTGTYQITVGSVGGDDAADTPGTDNIGVTPGVSKSGNLETGGDKDVFSLTVVSGASYQVDLRGSTSSVGTLTDPFLRILDVNGRQLARNDDGGSGFESRLAFNVRASGDIYIEAGAFSSRQTGTYQIDVAQTATSTSALGDLIGQTAEHAPLLQLGVIEGGKIDFHGDQDMYQFALEAGQTYQFNVRGSHSGHGTLWDPQSFLYDNSGILVAQDDDSGTSFDSSITFVAPTSDSYYLNVMANIGDLSQSVGTYSVDSILL